VAPEGVLASGHGFEMTRVHATRVAAEMIELQPIRNVADEKLVGNEVRDALAPYARVNELAVPPRSCRAPDPTGVGSAGTVDLRPEPLLEGWLAPKLDRPGRTPAHVMRLTPATGGDRSLASLDDAELAEPWWSESLQASSVRGGSEVIA
jgi:hypothetical protein